MKNFLLYLVLTFVSIPFMNACSCFGKISFCELVNISFSEDRGLVFRGEYIQEQVIDQFTYAAQFKILEIYQGEVILPDSQLANDNSFENTASEVWLQGGQSNLCYVNYSTDVEGLFVVYYDEYFGYTTNICEQGYSVIVDENAMIGNWTDNFNKTEKTLSEIILLLDDDACLVSTEDELVERSISIYPNPVLDNRIYFDMQNGLQLDSATIEIYNTNNQKMYSKHLSRADNSINTNELNKGVYYMIITDGKSRYTDSFVII